MGFSVAVSATADGFILPIYVFEMLYGSFATFRAVDEIIVFPFIFARCAESDRRNTFVPAVDSELKRFRWNSENFTGVDFYISGLCLERYRSRLDVEHLLLIAMSMHRVSEALAGREFVVVDCQSSGVERL